MVEINRKLNNGVPITNEDEEKLLATFEGMADKELQTWHRRLFGTYQQLDVSRTLASSINDVGHTVSKSTPAIEYDSATTLNASDEHNDQLIANIERCRVLAYEATFARH